MSARPSRAVRPLLSLALVVGLASCASAAAPGAGGAESPGAVAAPGAAASPGGGVEASVASSPVERAFEAVRHDPARLYPFLRAMPKGGDLHSHLSGAVYAESFLAWAAADGRCVDVATLTVVAAPCAADAGRPTAQAANQDQALRDRLIDAFSTRNYHPATENGHTRFFTTFDRFGVAGNGRTGDMIAEVQRRAADGNVLYVELMNTIGGVPAGAMDMAWDDDPEVMRQRFLDAGLVAHVEQARRSLDAALARRDEVLGCASAPAPECDVEVRFLYQVLRAFPPSAVFGMILTGYEMASRDDRVVGFNLVQPEDHRVAMRDYSLHMRTIGDLRDHYPDVPVTLHAGELWPGLVPTEGLRFHVREAVEVAGARRIGHGVDILHEDDPYELMAAMARNDVLVEINLTSNDVILGVSGAEHPLAVYLEAGVPTALSTDDEGVSRSEMTLEWMRAVLDQGVDYATLVGMARNSLEYAFVEGASAWADADGWTPVAPCSASSGGWRGPACERFAAASVKARLQRAFELELAAFEGRW